MPHRGTCFVPVSIGYERVIEAGAYEHELRGGEKAKEDAAGLLQSSEVLRHRYGRINLQIGRLLTLVDLRNELGYGTQGALSPAQRRNVVNRLANRVMDEINRVTAVTPGALVALSLLSHSHAGLSHSDLYARCHRLLGVLRAQGARVTPATTRASGALRPEAFTEALRMFMDGDLVEAHANADAADAPRRRRIRVAAGPDAFYTVPVSKRLALDTSKNIIVHFFLERGLVATAMRASPEAPVETALLHSRVQSLSRMLKHEFRFRAGSSFDEILEQTLRAMAEAGELRLDDGTATPGPGHDDWTGLEWLEVYADILKNFLEGYRVAARGLTHLLKGALPEKDLVKRTLATGAKMFDDGEIQRREAVSTLIIQNALHALRDERYLGVDEGRLQLAESFRSAETVATIEGRITAWLQAEEPEG